MIFRILRRFIQVCVGSCWSVLLRQRRKRPPLQNRSRDTTDACSLLTSGPMAIVSACACPMVDWRRFASISLDTTESRSSGKRSGEQGAYFGLTRVDAVKLGNEAKAFTAAALERPFTVQTRWRKVFGPTRYYACVFTADGDDLAELLVRNGLARIYGMRTPLPDGRDSRTYLHTLKGLGGASEIGWSWRLAKPVVTVT